MNWILVVLQTVAIAGDRFGVSEAHKGWSVLGEFQSEKACVAASVQLAKATVGVHGVKNFQCLNKGDNK